MLWVLRLVPSSKPSQYSYKLRSVLSNNNVADIEKVFDNNGRLRSESEPAVAPELLSYEPEDPNTDKIFECSNTYNAVPSSPLAAGASSVDYSREHSLSLSAAASGVPLQSVPDSDERVSPSTYALAAIRDDASESIIQAAGGAVAAADNDDRADIPNAVEESSLSACPPPPDHNASAGLDEPVPREILPAKILAWEPSWTILSNDYCVQV